MKRVAAILAGTVLVACLAACGGGDPPMTGDAARALRAQVTAVHAAIDVRDTDGAARALDDLRRTVDRLRRADDLSDQRAADILAAAGDVHDQLVTITTTTTTTTTTTLPPAPATTPGKAPKGDDKGGHGDKGKK